MVGASGLSSKGGLAESVVKFSETVTKEKLLTFLSVITWKKKLKFVFMTPVSCHLSAQSVAACPSHYSLCLPLTLLTQYVL